MPANLKCMWQAFRLMFWAALPASSSALRQVAPFGHGFSGSSLPGLWASSPAFWSPVWPFLLRAGVPWVTSLSCWLGLWCPRCQPGTSRECKRASASTARSEWALSLPQITNLRSLSAWGGCPLLCGSLPGAPRDLQLLGPRPLLMPRPLIALP